MKSRHRAFTAVALLGTVYSTTPGRAEHPVGPGLPEQVEPLCVHRVGTPYPPAAMASTRPTAPRGFQSVPSADRQAQPWTSTPPTPASSRVADRVVAGWLQGGPRRLGPLACDGAVLESVNESGEIARVATTRAHTRATYDRLSRYYELVEGVWERPARRAGLRALGARAGETLLEVGCGPGYAFLEIARAVGPNGRAVGVDLAHGMCRLARGRVTRNGLSLRSGVVEGDASCLPLASGCVDGVFMSFVLELFDTPQIPRVLGECRRVLRPGGRLVVVALSKEGPESLERRLYERGHVRFPRLLDCRPIYVARAVREAGMAIASARRLSLWGLPVEVVRAQT